MQHTKECSILWHCDRASYVHHVSFLGRVTGAGAPEPRSTWNTEEQRARHDGSAWTRTPSRELSKNWKEIERYANYFIDDKSTWNTNTHNTRNVRIFCGIFAKPAARNHTLRAGEKWQDGSKTRAVDGKRIVHINMSRARWFVLLCLCYTPSIMSVQINTLHIYKNI